MAQTISPTAVTLQENARQLFTASVKSTWTATCGTITSGGDYTAPLHPSTSCSVKATAVSGGGTATAKITVTSPVTLSPTAPKIAQGSTQQFTASQPVAWKAACGTISTGGLYTASGTVGSDCTIEAIATGSVAYTAYDYAVTTAPAPPMITPSSATTSEGLAQQFTANIQVNWSASCGSITGSGLFTASAAQGDVCTITAAAQSNATLTSTATDTIGAPVPLVISPAQPNLAENATQQFTSGAAATWTTSCGAINATTGLYTAPLTPQACNVTASATDGTGRTTSTTVNVVQLNYTTFRGDNGRTGAQTQEFTLTPSNVNSTSFGLAWSTQLDSTAWTQPLYMNAVPINGAVHNVVYETTAYDSVYAIDGDTGKVLWRKSFLSSGVVPVPGGQVGVSMKYVGIVGTPVIDPVAGTLYVVAMTDEQNKTVIVHRLHALNILTGQEQPGSPVVIAAPGFVDADELQRPALLLANGSIYVAFGSYNDVLPYQGFVLAFDSTTLALQASFSDDPDEAASQGGGGIWMSGTGPASDAEGNVYTVSGNGFADGVNNYGQSAIKFSSSLQVMDYFTPYDHNSESEDDVDLGAGGPLVLPDQSGTFPHEMIVCGKTTPIFVLNRDDMGGVGSTSDDVIQRLDGQLGETGNFTASGQPCFSTPAYWNQSVYFVANHDVMKMFTLDASTGLLSTTPTSKGSFTYSWPGAYASISANGSTNGIVWTYDKDTGTVRAADATAVGTELYVTTILKDGKWSTPTPINGHVYVEAENELYGFATH